MADIAITGATGMLGRALMRAFADVFPVGTGLSRTGPGVERLDLTDEVALAAFFARHRPKFVIHAAAERRPDVSERDPDRTRALNVGATAVLGRLARQAGAHVLYISTDYVFDGTSAPYRPGDVTNPLNLYGQTKLEGEKTLLAAGDNASVLRVGVLFGEVEFPEESAVTALLNDVRGATRKTVDDWGQRYPTSTTDVAVLCRQMRERHAGGNSIGGVWHWSGDERLTKYGQAQIIGEVLGLPTGHLVPDPSPPAGAPRPHDCRLDCSALERLGLGRRTPFRQAITEAFEQSQGFISAAPWPHP